MLSSAGLLGMNVALCLLKVRNIHDRRGVPHLRIHGKGSKLRYISRSGCSKTIRYDVKNDTND